MENGTRTICGRLFLVSPNWAAGKYFFLLREEEEEEEEEEWATLATPAAAAVNRRQNQLSQCDAFAISDAGESRPNRSINLQAGWRGWKVGGGGRG